MMRLAGACSVTLRPTASVTVMGWAPASAPLSIRQSKVHARANRNTIFLPYRGLKPVNQNLQHAARAGFYPGVDAIALGQCRRGNHLARQTLAQQFACLDQYGIVAMEIGRASCRERACQYV